MLRVPGWRMCSEDWAVLQDELGFSQVEEEVMRHPGREEPGRGELLRMAEFHKQEGGGGKGRWGLLPE